MERPVRMPLQGISNIVRFNWHFYALAAALVFGLILGGTFSEDIVSVVLYVVAALISLGTLISLAVSYYIYDYTNLYDMPFLAKLNLPKNAVLVNINAGFDETSEILYYKFPQSKLHVFDFYDAAKHTEISIERARKVYPPYHATQIIATTRIPLADNCADTLFLLMAAHEIRNEDERQQFFKETYRVLANNGKLVVLEHQRDLPNFLAFNFGFFHFYSTKSWKKIITKSGFSIVEIENITPFLKLFICTKNGIAS